MMQLESLIQSLRKEGDHKSQNNSPTSMPSPQMVRQFSMPQETSQSVEPSWAAMPTPPHLTVPTTLSYQEPEIHTLEPPILALEPEIHPFAPTLRYDDQTKAVDSILWKLNDTDEVLEDQRSLLMTGQVCRSATT